MFGYAGLQTPLQVKFPSSKSGLATVGFMLKNSDGSTNTARTTSGVVNLSNGAFSVVVTFASPWIGSVLWDTGEGSPLYAAEEINIVAAPAVPGSSMVVSDKTGFSLATAPPTPTQIRQEIDANSTKLASVNVDTQAIRAKTDSQSGAWGPSISGAYLIHVRTVIAGSNPVVPIPGVAVSLLNADGSVTLDNRRTDSMGYASFPRDNGTYIVRHMLAGYSFADDAAVVAGADVNHVCAGTAYVLPINADPDTQVIYFPDTKAGRVIKARPTSGQLINQTLIDKEYKDATTTAGSSGVTLTLIRGVEYRVTVDGWGSLTFTVSGDAQRYFAAYVREAGLVPPDDGGVIVDGGVD
jgi:hypothetical protein